MEAAALLVIVLSNGQGSALYLGGFCGIIILLIVVDSSIGFSEEYNSGNAVKALMDSLAPKTKVKRNGKWVATVARHLVPGDMVPDNIGSRRIRQCFN